MTDKPKTNDAEEFAFFKNWNGNDLMIFKPIWSNYQKMEGYPNSRIHEGNKTGYSNSYYSVLTRLFHRAIVEAREAGRQEQLKMQLCCKTHFGKGEYKAEFCKQDLKEAEQRVAREIMTALIKETSIDNDKCILDFDERSSFQAIIKRVLRRWR